MFDVPRNARHVLARHARHRRAARHDARASRLDLLTEALSRRPPRLRLDPGGDDRPHDVGAARVKRGAILAALLLGCASGRDSGPSNDLLIVGYDREPDTMNRYATHILEDIQSCVIEGLVTTDERMNVVPVLAAEVPTIANGGVVMRGDGGMDVTWKLRPGVKWHDGQPHTSADVKFTADAILKGDWKPESTDGFDRISSVDTPDSLTAVVHYKEPYAPYQLQFLR